MICCLNTIKLNKYNANNSALLNYNQEIILSKKIALKFVKEIYRIRRRLCFSLLIYPECRSKPSSLNRL